MQEKLPLSEETADQEILIRCKTFKDALRLAREKSGKSEQLISYELNDKGHKIDQSTLSLALSDNPSQKKNFPTEAIDDFVNITNEIPLRYLALKRGYGLIKLKSTLELELEKERAEKEELQKKLTYFEELISKVNKK